MKNRIIAMVLGLALGATSANAATITDQFSFLDSSNAVIASGSFSYSSTATGTIGFADLSAFTFTAFGTSYNLGYVNSVSTDPSAGNYVYFGYDTVAHQFVPAAIDGYNGPYSAILAATDGYNGFFVSPLAGQADPAGTKADGQIFQYTTLVPGGDTTFASGNAEKLIQVTSIPEPGTWALLIVGFIALAGLARGRQRALLAS
ncbi:PEP-CTERM sorting domain-containing protein [uncultured Bradyrhizobium sp.]|uniref:PEP-CTERM sorting domain-containing protein n=1 Tax=uncultured Bradyrhizobium sp. TaxID=199684 RepID=UPI0026339EB1|nr:PEP-CTERM sorting domain-containing protein [uncultured Bradyrhizobium sp.]